jgi:hypothetical protein
MPRFVSDTSIGVMGTVINGINNRGDIVGFSDGTNERVRELAPASDGTTTKLIARALLCGLSRGQGRTHRSFSPQLEGDSGWAGPTSSIIFKPDVWHIIWTCPVSNASLTAVGAGQGKRHKTWRLVFDRCTGNLMVRHQWRPTATSGVDDFGIAEFLVEQGVAQSALLTLLFDEATVAA